MMMKHGPYTIVFCTPALYSAGGVERVVSFKASYFAEQLGYDVTIIVTEGRGRACFFPLSDQVKVINFELGFEALWQASFVKKVFLYLSKQRQYKKRLKAELMHIRPDITISMLRREINFLTDILDGSKKIGELHVNRTNYRNFEANDSNALKRLFAKLWMRNLVGKLKRLDQLVVLTEKSKASWPELSNVSVIPDPVTIEVKSEEVKGEKCSKRVVTIGRYAYQKGYDLLLKAWSEVEKHYPDWTLDIYGQGDRTSCCQLMGDLGIDVHRCHLNGPVENVDKVYQNSSVFVLSSRFEGFGMVLVEAMACGLPVVSFDCPAGPDEIITDGLDGLLVPSGDVHALAEKLMALMADENLRKRLGEQARQSARRYEMASIANQWTALFEKVRMNYNVTIGIPVFEAERYLSRSLESALMQSYPSIEFLLVDDGSTDGSVSIIQDYQKSHPRGADIHIISHDQNMGVSAARNHIIEEASGTYLYFLDADDVIAEHTIALMMDNIRQYEAEIVFGSYEKISTDGVREVYQYPELKLLGEDELASFAYRKYAGIQASACNYLVKTSLLREHHHHFIETNYWEDFVFTFDLVTMVKRAVLLPDITYTYLCRENSLSHYQQRAQIPKEEILQNVRTVAYLRETSSLLYNKVYYPNRCYLVVMTEFYIACNVLKRRWDIVPTISDKEIKDMLTHPATFRQICHFRQSRLKNGALYVLGKLPASLCVVVIRCLGKMKKLI